MAHLDFREAFSTPEEKVFSPQATAIAIPATVAVSPLGKNFLSSLGLSRSTWANIVFVAIASVGGLVCAFYFFNGAEVLRAAASWPGEYLYPRPPVTDQVVAGNEQPNPVDQYSATENEARSDKTGDSKNPSEQTAAPTRFVTSAGPTSPSTPPVVAGPPPIVTGPPPIVVPPVVPPIIPPPPTSLPLMNLADNVASSAGTFVQALLQDPTGTTSSTVTTAPDRADKSVKKITTVAKRKISKASQKVVSAANSTSRSLQQTTNQTQITPARSMTQMTMGATAPVNQMMSSGGMGGVSGLGGGIGGAAGAAGAGVGSGTGAGAVGGTVSGLGGGLSGGGLGGTISGVGGTVGGVIGGLGGGHH
jgi:hypothetical protein